MTMRFKNENVLVLFRLQRAAIGCDKVKLVTQTGAFDGRVAHVRWHGHKHVSRINNALFFFQAASGQFEMKDA